MDWTAVGAAGAVAAVGFAVYQYIAGGFRSLISYEVTNIGLKIPETAKEDKWSSDHLDVYRYVVKNNSFRHLDNVVLRVQFSASKCWYAGVEDAGSLDERSIKSTVENGEVSYEISSFPAREKIVFVLACHGHALRGRDMKGGSSKYKLLKRYEYVSLLASRISSFALGAAVVYFFGKVVLWAQS